MSSTQGKILDLNCDLGESYGVYELGHDADMIPLVTSVNIACGFHAGDPRVMQETVKLAQTFGVAVGAHPSFPDLQGFGRRRMHMDEEDLHAALIYQIGALKSMAEIYTTGLQHVKPHGALYNMACEDKQMAAVIARACAEVDKNLILLAPFGSALAAAGRELGLPVANEVFADRAYEPDGSLRSRQYPDALLQTEEDVSRHVLRMVLDGEIEAVDGSRIPVEPQSICLHGDTKHAVQFARHLQLLLTKHGIKVAPLREVVSGGII